MASRPLVDRPQQDRGVELEPYALARLARERTIAHAPVAARIEVAVVRALQDREAVTVVLFLFLDRPAIAGRAFGAAVADALAGAVEAAVLRADRLHDNRLAVAGFALGALVADTLAVADVAITRADRLDRPAVTGLALSATVAHALAGIVDVAVARAFRRNRLVVARL